ncbi:sigma-70 family RNA polymerase sigma factor [Azospirillum thermophilum]|uniref:RNA polymerase n=1 Tax=Azospirillum thermophilum TaxID=2202148 RepID=A0A2S2CPX0_9PROT|nr:sigma-70 family RNA polymerase sigma factor [Azospirillum thermophilum]AWK86499.1 RNA polymerase [Azospirillum thermophilum]
MFSLRNQLGNQLRALRRYALALSRDRDDAEDLVQETLVRAISGAQGFRPEGDLRAWLFGILHNVHVSARRRDRVRTDSASSIEMLAQTSIPATQPGHVELRRTIEAFATLPEEQRQVLTLVAVEGMSYQEAATVLNIPLGTLMSRLARGREALRAATDHGRRGPVSLRVVR